MPGHVSWIRPSGFHFLGFRNINFCVQQGRQQSASLATPNMNEHERPGLCIYVPQWEGAPPPLQHFQRIMGTKIAISIISLNT
jgi:hypothetical protein